jgi:hypothetical protein
MHIGFVGTDFTKTFDSEPIQRSLNLPFTALVPNIVVAGAFGGDSVANAL